MKWPAPPNYFLCLNAHLCRLRSLPLCFNSPENLHCDPSNSGNNDKHNSIQSRKSPKSNKLLDLRTIGDYALMDEQNQQQALANK